MALVDVIIGYAKGAQGDVGPQGPQGEIGPAGPQGSLPPLVNNALATEAGVAALDAAMGKTLQDEITQTNSNLTDLAAVSPDFTKTVYGSVNSNTVGWVDKTVDLTNCSVIMLVIKNSGGTAIFGSTFIPTYLFKVHDTIQCRVSINSTTFVECDAKYISNTQIQLYTNNASYVAWFYQFK